MHTPLRDSRSNDSIISYDTTLVTQIYNELNWVSNKHKTFLAMTFYIYFCLTLTHDLMQLPYSFNVI